MAIHQNEERGPETQPAGRGTEPLTEQVEYRFPGRRVFVTGGARGIGRSIVEAFCRAGARVAFCDIDTVKGARTAAETGARFAEVDVCNGEALEACIAELFEAWGDLDVIINNVGISRFSPLVETSVEEFDRILATNLRPAFITSSSTSPRRATS